MDWAIRSEKHEDQLDDQLRRMAYTIGVVLGDGYLQSYSAQKNGKWYPLQVVRVGKPDLDTIERVRDQIEAVFGARYAIMPKTLKSGLTFYQLHAYRRDIFEFFATNTALKTKIPEFFFSADADTKREMIAGLMDSDGYISERPDPKGVTRWNIGFSNTKRDLVSGLAALMSSLGVKIGKVCEYQKAEYALLYSINPNLRSFTDAGCYFRAERKAKKLSNCTNFMLGSETLHAAPST